MASDTARNIVVRVTFSESEAAAAEALKQLCDTRDRLDLKVEPAMLREAGDDTVNAYLCYAGDALVGLCTLDGGREVELCGMVHPAHRRNGIGRALLAAALAECRGRGVSNVLLICEDASAPGRAFAAAAGGRLAFAEHRMELSAEWSRGRRDDRLALRQAGPRDVDTIAGIAAPAFGDPEDFVRRRIAADMLDPSGRLYLATLDGAPVGTLKIFSNASTAGIYGFAVAPDLQGHGIGRDMLTRAIEQLHAEGYTRITLEVLTDNHRALALYRSTGFRTITTYGYYALSL